MSHSAPDTSSDPHATGVFEGIARDMQAHKKVPSIKGQQLLTGP